MLSLGDRTREGLQEIKGVGSYEYLPQGLSEEKVRKTGDVRAHRTQEGLGAAD